MNTDKYILQEVTTSAQEREWLDLPKKIYKGNRNWVCPLDQDITEVFDPARNELFADGEAVRWVVRNKAGEVVGRIAAFYNREKAAIEEQPTGGCGFFEAIDDQQVADMMFDASRMWLASRGMEAMDGPINFGQRRDWWGLLVEGYEFQPLYANPYNPPYYKELFEGAQAGSIPQDWCKGYEDGAVAITDLGPEVADGTAEKVAEVEAALKDGSLHVFDTSKFTVDGAEVTTAPIDLTYYDFSTGSPVAVYQGETKEAISDGYFHEGELRAAPTFALRIDGIIEDADPVA